MPGIAIVGMAGRFPGAKNIRQFWQNLVAGKRSIRPLSDEELTETGIPKAITQQPNYVKSAAYIEDIDLFDAAFFGMLPREAELMNPQHRLFLECAYQALEEAGYDVETYQGLIGMFGGSGFPSYLSDKLLPHLDSYDAVDQFQIAISNDRDTLTSIVSYKLNLKGPCMAVQTSCSTGMVAVHLACQSLFNYECDMALAGGVALRIPSKSGYLYAEGGILSPDGHCRTFDANAKGTVMGDGVSVVVLKRLENALEDHDHIYATVRGSAVNNDGLEKVGFTAPGTHGQAQVIAEAMAVADVAAEDIDYVEAHGTATPLGDAAELSAMLKAFGDTEKKQYCAIGSVKSNVGHLDRASGTTGLIKTALALSHRKIPPSLDFEQTSPDIRMEDTPFFVNTALKDWPDRGRPALAGISSFGIGGTNVHAVLEEAPSITPPLAPPQRGEEFLLVLSAKTEQALEQATRNLIQYLQAHPDVNMYDAAFTLQAGRTAFNHRKVMVCAGREDAIQALEHQDQARVMSEVQVHRNRPVAFMFPDTSEAYADAATDLYEHEPHFKEIVDECLQMLPSPQPSPFGRGAGGKGLTTFILEYALARMLMDWGIVPHKMLGSGTGEYVAACLSGVVALEDVLKQLAQPEKPGAIPIRRGKTDIPYISGATGKIVRTDVIADQTYWRTQIQQPQQMEAGIAELLKTSDMLLVEIGGGQELCQLSQQHPNCSPEQRSLILPIFAEPVKPAFAVRLLLNSLGRLWLAGVEIDWQKMYHKQPCKRLSLPTDPFQKQRYWVDDPASEQEQGAKKTDIREWFYAPIWDIESLKQTEQLTAKNWLVFEDDAGISRELSMRLRQKGDMVTLVRPGSTYNRQAHNEFTIDPGIPEDYETLFRQLAESGQTPSDIIHAWSVNTPSGRGTGGEDSVARFQAVQRIGFYSLMYLAQAIGNRAGPEALRLTVISDSMQPVGETDIVPEKATLSGLIRVIPQEYQQIRCRMIDLHLAAERSRSALIENVLAELRTPITDITIAYRSGKRLVQHFNVQQLTTGPEAIPLRQGGVYLMTGGLGAVGLILAEYLARSFQAKLILISRSGLPDRDTWTDRLNKDEPVAQTIRIVQRLEELGAKVLLLKADVASEQQMRRAMEHAEQRFGVLHGVIHAAGLNDQTAFQSVQQSEAHVCERHFLPKVYGLYVLDAALQNRSLDFFLCMSSLSSILGGLGLSSYAAANSFMDAYVHQHNQGAKIPWMTINWDTWQTKKQEDGKTTHGAAIAQFEMSPEEGRQAFALALSSGQTHLVNSTGDLQQRIRQWIDLEALTALTLSAPATIARPELTTAYVPAANDHEQRITAIWQQVLGLEQIGIHDNFFDLGGNSLVGLQVINLLQKEFDRQIPVVALFEAPTINTLAKYVLSGDTVGSGPDTDFLTERRRKSTEQAGSRDIAIIGMTGRFPGADSVEKFWQNLCDGVESVTHFSDEELLASGVSPQLIDNPAYIKTRPIIEGADLFDAYFFGYTPREAELMDPQHRLFLECCWKALETAGYHAEKYKGMIGVFGGTNLSMYLMRLSQDSRLVEQVGADQLMIGNDKDSLASTVSYKLNLTGPSFAVQTFCSTSLVATHLACKSLLDGECDVALAGGVSVRIPQRMGHLYEEGGMSSSDSHCRTFDAQAGGTFFGDGVAVVALKRLSDALEDGDTIQAVIRASAINNDGSLKVSYAAPSVAGQAQVVAETLERSGISPETIGYLEAHGTATVMGDPIEIASLSRAFRRQTANAQYCAIGSVKTNVGHLDRASGVTGLIKAALSVKTGLIPPHLNYQTPNPEIDFENSPFYVSTELSDWPLNGETPRRAGVNSLGMGGTNAHIIVEEPPQPATSSPSRPAQVLYLSARTERALETATDNLVRHIQKHPDQNLADIAYTLQMGRADFAHRRIAVCHNTDEALEVLQTKASDRCFSHVQAPVNRPVVFMFPGVGEQYLYMAEDLYGSEPVFRQCLEECCQVLYPYLGTKLYDLLYPQEANTQQRPEGVNLRAMLGRETAPLPPAAEKLNQTAVIQPVIFAVEYALAKLLMSWGIRPQAMLGYSVGEYVAACLSGVLSLPDAIKLVAERARLIQESEEGRMFTVALSAEAIQAYLSDEISLAIHNGQATCVVAGSEAAIAELGNVLEQQDIAYREVPATHAFHSHRMRPLADSLTRLVKTVTLNPPTIPYLSNVSGTWITAEETTDPGYWARHLCRTVQFFDSLEVVLGDGQQTLLEVGPGQSLESFAKQHPACHKEQFPLILPTMRYGYHQQSDLTFLLKQIGKLWLVGVEPDWEAFYRHEKRHRVPLPTYPFERERYWIEPALSKAPAAGVEIDLTKSPEEIIF